MKLLNKDKPKDVKIGMKNVPESVDFKFFETLQNYDKSIIVELREVKKELSHLKNITKFKIVALSSFLTFIATLCLCMNSGFDEFIMSIIGRISG